MLLGCCVVVVGIVSSCIVLAGWGVLLDMVDGVPLLAGIVVMSVE